MKVIGIGGQMQNGKDTIADYLAAKLPSYTNSVWNRDAFASSVKSVYCNTFDVDMDFVEMWKVIHEPPPGFDMPVRQSLQFIGDGFRKIQDNIWVELAARRLKPQTIISDVRYINELKKIESLHGVNILVWRKGRENNDPNGSEAQMKPLIDWLVKSGMEGVIHAHGPDKFIDAPEDMKYVDVFIRNEGTVEDLHKKIDNLVIPYLLFCGLIADGN